MDAVALRRSGRGPFRAEQIRSGDPYELSHGHPIYRAPAGGRRGAAILVGASVLSSDPGVRETGLDVGYTSDVDMLRAPDIAVGNVPDRPGWVQGAPDLGVEYADESTNESELVEKVKDLLDMGTKFVWVVRLLEPQCVEVHSLGQATRMAPRRSLVTAPGVLKNPVLVEALYDRLAAEPAILVNLLQRRGYESLEAAVKAASAKGASR